MSHLKLKPPMGVSDFKKLITENYLFVDKTLLIKDIIEDGSEVILFPRPRRFGKTLNMSMLKYFFDITGDHSDLFKHLNIAKIGDDYMQAQGKSPVIYITLKDVKAETFELARGKLASKLALLYKEHDYLLSAKSLTEHDKTVYKTILTEKATAVHLESALENLSRWLHNYHNAKTYIFIDEYDAPIVSAVEYDYSKSMILFIRNFLGSALKDNLNLNKGILTGIMRISKESIFSGINNLMVSGYLSQRYGEFFGFEEHEVQALIKASEVKNQNITEVKDWYNGYVIANKLVYNPWSIMNYLYEDCQLKPYWVNTSDNYLIKQAFAHASSSIKEDFETLIKGKSIIRSVQENLTIHDIENQYENALWSLLCLSGYLKIINYEFDLDEIRCELAIPNKEILALYTKFIKEWFSQTLDIKAYINFLSSLTEGDLPAFHHYLSRFLTESTSHFDLQQKEPERVYHSLVLGMIVGLRGQYSVKSNRESGFGRYDVMLIPNDKSKLGIIIEFKTAKNSKDIELEKTAQLALKQIQDKAYRHELEQSSVNTILELGLAFAGKRVVYQHKFITKGK